MAKTKTVKYPKFLQALLEFYSEDELINMVEYYNHNPAKKISFLRDISYKTGIGTEHADKAFIKLVNFFK